MPSDTLSRVYHQLCMMEDLPCRIELSIGTLSSILHNTHDSIGAGRHIVGFVVSIVDLSVSCIKSSSCKQPYGCHKKLSTTFVTVQTVIEASRFVQLWLPQTLFHLPV